MNSRVDCQPKQPQHHQILQEASSSNPKKEKEKSRNFADIIKLQSPRLQKGASGIHLYNRAHKRKHFHKSSFSFFSSSSRIFRFLLIFEQEGYSLRSVIEDGSCMHYKIECGYCCEW
jgi:hypothetical protein